MDEMREPCRCEYCESDRLLLHVFAVEFAEETDRMLMELVEKTKDASSNAVH